MLHTISSIHTPSRPSLLSLLLAVLAVSAGSGALSGQVTGQLPQTQEESFFYSDGRRVPLTIIPDSFAAMPRDEVTLSRLDGVVRRFGLRAVRQLPGGLVILAGADSLRRSSALALAAVLRRAAAEAVVNVGVMARPEQQDTTPLFLTDEILVQFVRGATSAQIAQLAARYGLDTVPMPYLEPNQRVLRVTTRSQGDALTLANRLHEQRLVEYAQPNFILVVEPRGTAGGGAPVIPDDPLFGDQWHLHNTGQGSGTADADIDAPEAWSLTMGSSGVVISVIDDGFDMAHEDLVPNLWTNTGETAGNGIDDDSNGFIDDVNGWDFSNNDNDPSPGATNNHGTAVAGAAAARGNNAIGVSGSCPNCRLMLLRNGTTVASQVQVFNYARQNGGAVITNSWGYALGAGTAPIQTAINDAATLGRGGLGSVVLFAMNNGNFNDCTGTPDISSLASVIAVSASSNQDRKVTESAWGNCMDVLGPTHRGYGGSVAFTGTLNIMTADRTGAAGYNNTSPPAACPGETANQRYTACFGGTSAATPVTAGIAGLLLSVDAGLTRQAVQRLLQDAADRIEDSNGSYRDNTGFSSPASGAARNGHGRVNAFEAVRVAAPAASGGRGGADVFLRDNRLDWGNTEQPSNTLFEPTRGFIGHWASMDIKVDAPPYQTAPTAITFDAFVDEVPSAMAPNVNRVYVRVRNRGPTAAGPVTVRLFWAQFGTALPSLPPDFWSIFPANSTHASNKWGAIGCSGGSTACSIPSVAYSGATVAGSGFDVAQVVRFDFAAPPIDPVLPNHFCLLAMIDAGGDRPLPLTRPVQASDFVVDWLTPNDNNVTHRNYLDLPTDRSRAFDGRFWVRNPTVQPVQAVLRMTAPRGWDVTVAGVPPGQPFSLAAGEERLVSVQIAAPGRGEEGEVAFVQERVDGGRSEVMGGLTYGFRTGSTPAYAAPGGLPAPAAASRAGLRTALSLHAGVALPFGPMDAVVDAGPTSSLDLLVAFTPRLGVDLRAGWARLQGSDTSPDLDVWDASVNLKVIPVLTTPWLFVNGGVGAYSAGSSPGSGAWKGGYNLGAGLGLPLLPGIVVEGTFNYHRTFSTTPDLRFGRLQLGVLWSL